MNEHSFIKAVHRYLPLDILKWKIHDTYTGGVPDAFYAGPAGILFCEYKYVKKFPKKELTPVNIGLKPLQKAWLDSLDKYKIPSFVIIGFDSKAIVLTPDKIDTLYLSAFKNFLTFKEVADLILWRVTYDTYPNKPSKNLEQD